MDVETKLREEIESSIDELNKKKLGSDDYTKSVDSIVKLTDRMIELKKVENELELKKGENSVKWEQMNAENDLKTKQLIDENKDRKWKNGIGIAGIAVPVALTIWGTIRTMKFENENVPNGMGKLFMNRLLPKK